MLGKAISKVNKDKNLKELLKGSAITFVLKISGMLLGYVLIYLISKKNGSEGVGYYSLINQLLLVLGIIAAFGTNDSVLRYVGQFNNDEQRSNMHSLYRGIMKIIIPLSILLGLLVFFLSSQIGQWFFNNSDYSDAIKLVGIALPFFAMNSVSMEFIRGLKRLKTSEFIRSVSRPVMIIAAMFFFWNGEIPNIYIIYFFVIAVFVNALLSNMVIWMHLKKIAKPAASVFKRYELLKVSSPMMITGVSTALMGSMSLFLLEFFDETKEVGVFSVALRFAQLIGIVLIVINTIAAPKFSELFWSNKISELQTVIRQSAKMMFWASLALAIIVIFGSKTLLGVFGQEFISGQIALIILVFAQFVNAATGSVSLFLNMSGNQNFLRNVTAITLAMQFILAIIIIPLYGILGAAISTSVARILKNLACIYYVKKKLNLKTYYLPFS